jgi:hypothetical protein
MSIRLCVIWGSHSRRVMGTARRESYDPGYVLEVVGSTAASRTAEDSAGRSHPLRESVGEARCLLTRRPAGDRRGARTSAIIYSLVETAKANSLNLYMYLKHLFEVLPQLPDATDPEALANYISVRCNVQLSYFHSNTDLDVILFLIASILYHIEKF